MKLPYVIIEDLPDPDAADLLRRPRPVDEAARAQRQLAPIGHGLHDLTCADCGRPFRHDDNREAFCPLCAVDVQAQLVEAWRYEYRFPARRFRTGGE